MTAKKDLERQVIVKGRENGISHTLFRNVIGTKLGLNITDFESLDLLFFRGVSTPSELAKYTGLSSGAVTAMIDRLEESGLVERRPNPADRRGTLISIVKVAADNIAPLFASARLAQNELLAGYSVPELELLADYFEKSAAMFEREGHKLAQQKRKTNPGSTNRS